MVRHLAMQVFLFPVENSRGGGGGITLSSVPGETNTAFQQSPSRARQRYQLVQWTQLNFQEKARICACSMYVQKIFREMRPTASGL